MQQGHLEISDFKAESLATWAAKATTKTPNFEQETPKDNFVLKTNTAAKGQFFILLEVKSKDKTEVYEAAVNQTKGDIFKLKSKDNTLIKSVLVEL